MLWLVRKLTIPLLTFSRNGVSSINHHHLYRWLGFGFTSWRLLNIKQHISLERLGYQIRFCNLPPGSPPYSDTQLWTISTPLPNLDFQIKLLVDCNRLETDVSRFHYTDAVGPAWNLVTLPANCVTPNQRTPPTSSCTAPSLLPTVKSYCQTFPPTSDH